MLDCVINSTSNYKGQKQEWIEHQLTRLDRNDAVSFAAGNTAMEVAFEGEPLRVRPGHS